MDKLHELDRAVKALIAYNAELQETNALLTQENEAISAKVVAFATANAELLEEKETLQKKVAALESDNAALSHKFDEVQTQAIQGLDALDERDEVAASINQILATIESSKTTDIA